MDDLDDLAPPRNPAAPDAIEVGDQLTIFSAPVAARTSSMSANS
ncbi:MAG: hypothetical protein ACJ8AH_10430 [Stellaceae bacterium]